MLITFTFQPNKTNCSKRKLIEDFAYTLKRFYRKTFGSRYYKHKDKQFKFTIFLFHRKKKSKASTFTYHCRCGRKIHCIITFFPIPQYEKNISVANRRFAEFTNIQRF